MSCPNYDKSKGEQIALNVDGSLSSHKTDEEITYGRGIMDRITLSSQKSVKDPSRYAVGIFNGSELHLTPLKGIGKYLSLCASALTYLNEKKNFICEMISYKC